MNAIRNAIFVSEGDILTTATTRRASMLINGSTIFSVTKGLCLPVGEKSFHNLKGHIFQLLSKLTKDLKIIFIDEYSMLPQNYLYYIDQQLKQLKKCDCAFGGVVVVLIGYISQLHPMRQVPVWYERRVNENGSQKDDHSLLGMSLWFTHFRTLIKLEKNNRLDPNNPDSVIAAEILEGISVGEIIDENYNKVINTLSLNTMDLHLWKERWFEDESATRLFPNNDQVLKCNYE